MTGQMTRTTPGPLRGLAFFLLGGMLLSCNVAAHAHDQPHDMGKMWQESLAREPLAVSAAFDVQGRLWRAQVNQGHVVVSHSDDLGQTFSAPVPVNPEAEFVAADGENRPKIVAADNGNIYVSYTQSLSTPFAGHVRFSRSTDGGKSFSPPVTVNDHVAPVTHRFEAMGINARGQIYLAWLDKRDQLAARDQGRKFDGLSVYLAVSDDEGKSFHANARVAEHSCECCRVAMAMDRDGTPVIAWRHIFGKNTRDHALLRLDGAAKIQRASRDEWELDACPHHGPALAVAEDGVYHLAWFANSPGRHGLAYAHSADQGGHFSAPLAIGDPKAQASHPSVASVGKQVYVAWKEFDGERTVIKAMGSVDGGDHWSQLGVIATTADRSDHPLLISDGKRVFLSWNTLQQGHALRALPAAQPQERQ